MLFNVPYIRTNVTKFITEQLENKLQTKVSIGNVRFAFPFRLIIDDLECYDQEQVLMIEATRVAAKVEMLPLFRKKIHLSNAQLYGANLSFYQLESGQPYNFQFLLDAFSHPQKEKETSFDVKLGTLFIKRCNLRYEKRYLPIHSNTFDPAHINITDLSLSASIKHLTPDSVSASIKRFSFKESSGLSLKHLNLSIAAGRKSCTLSGFDLELPLSEMHIPNCSAAYSDFPWKQDMNDWLSGLGLYGSLDLKLTPCDIKAIIPKLGSFKEPIHLSAEWEGEDANITCKHLECYDINRNIQIEMQGSIHLEKDNPCLRAEVIKLESGTDLQTFLTRNLELSSMKCAPYLERLGKTTCQGKLYWSKKEKNALLKAHSQIGTIELDGLLQNDNQFELSFNSPKILLGNLVDGKEQSDLGEAQITAKAKGLLNDETGNFSTTCSGALHDFAYKGHTYHNIEFEASNTNQAISAEVHVDEADIRADASVQTDLSEQYKKILCDIQFERFSPHNLHLTSKYENELFAGHLTMDMQGKGWEHLNGTIKVSDINLWNGEEELSPTDIILRSSYTDEGNSISLESPILALEARGNYRWKQLYPTIKQIFHSYLPGVFPITDTTKFIDEQMDITLLIQDTIYAKRLLGIPLRIPQTAQFQGHLDGALRLVNIHGHIPELQLYGERLANLQWDTETSLQYLQSTISLNRYIKEHPIQMKMDLFAGNDRVMTNLQWDNQLNPRMAGEINITGEFYQDMSGNNAIHGRISPTSLIVNDTIWNIRPATIRWHDKQLDLQNIHIGDDNRYADIRGCISDNPQDSLRISIARLDLSYLFNIVNFHSVNFAGEATGMITAHSLFGNPQVNGAIRVPNFLYNKADMGALYARLSWKEKGLTINANIDKQEKQQHTTVNGRVIPGKGPENGIDLLIKADHTNMGFMNGYIGNILEKFRGETSGWFRVFGPLKNVDFEGRLKVDNASFHVKSLGVDYRITNDSVIINPGVISLPQATLYDTQGTPERIEHKASLYGNIKHRYTRHWSYDLYAKPENLLGYDFRDFGNQTFYGTIFATGDVHLYGQPGSFNVDVNGTTNPGTSFVYSKSNPGTITEAGFISFETRQDTSSIESVALKTKNTKKNSTDIRLNFDMNVTEDATLKVMMDARTGDYISLNGTGHFNAKYYNKGKFQMYGTYNVEDGVYKMSIQDVIHRDFLFLPNGTIVFGGNPMQAALNLKASYTIPNVSLDDLSGTGLGFSNTRVDCIMNLSGKVSAPTVTFDFDLPNANEDEKKMVHSMVSTDEERNLQVIYLLGFGTFYNYETQYMSGTNQSTMAMNSLLSSTISNQFNQIMSNAVGSKKWSFGANLRTGDTGWDNVDVEGILRGKFLNNRLLLNGNFGYRESYYSTNNFIGDFDVQYLLTPGGGIALKAYNETNDRYFIQSSLTTQGIGIQFKKDFNRWTDIFHSIFHRKKKTAKKNK